jgi:hypothetical protein
VKTIRCLKPNVTREAALRQFSPGGVTGLLRALRHGKLQSIADVYVPFRFYRVRIKNGRQTQTSLLALDAVEGTFDLYAFDALPDPGDVIEVDTRNCLEVRLEEAHARQIAAEKVRRIVFATGFFRIRNLRIEVEPCVADLHVPYWAAFYGRPTNLKLVVIDAVRRRVEGAKVRQVFEEWMVNQGGH